MAEVLDLTLSFTDHLRNLDDISAARGQALGEKYAMVIAECLTSSKSDTRSSATALLEASITKGVITLESIKKATERMKPAKQRTIAPILATYTKKMQPPPEKEKNSLSDRNRLVMPHSGKDNASLLASDAFIQEQHSVVQSSDSKITSSLAPPIHPLVLRPGKQNISRSSKAIHWPEFPEEPNNNDFATLKKAWSPLLPQATTSALFPVSGIAKQDDAKGGCELLHSAVDVDSRNNSSIVLDQIDLVFKWITYAICSKESTTGLQDLLGLLDSIVRFLVRKNHELTDTDALVIVPFLFEKSSVAKVSTVTELLSFVFP